MKLAEQIAEALFADSAWEEDEHKWFIDDSFYKKDVQQIIAAHLEPVREALFTGLGCAVAVCSDESSKDQIKAALALLDTSDPVTADEGDKRQDVAREDG